MTIVYPVGKGLYVNMTNRCPCACEFCIRKNGAGVYGSDPLWLEREPTVAEVNAALDAADLRQAAEVVFCGYGEPTERLDDLLAVARRIREVAPGLPIRVNTNGLADLIAGRPSAVRFAGVVDAVSISLNAPTAEEYVEICHPKFGLAAYAALLRFGAEVKAYVPSVTFTVVGTPEMTEARIAACRKVCDGVGVPLRVRTYSPPKYGAQGQEMV